MKIKQLLFSLLLLLTVSFQARAWDWGFDHNKYSLNASVTTVLLDKDGNNYGSPDIDVLAFSGNEIRGVASPTWDETDNQYIYYISVFLDAGENLDIKFKPFYNVNGEPVILDNEVVETKPLPIIANGTVGLGSLPSQIQPGADLNLSAIRIKEEVQTFNAGGTKAFALETTPEGINGFTITYEQNGKTVSPNTPGAYDVIISRPEDASYQAYNRTLKNALVIGLRKPIVTWPTSVDISEGQKLEQATFSGQDGDGTFSWSNPDYKCMGSGDYYMEMTFTPISPDYYPIKKIIKFTAKAHERSDINIEASTPQQATYTNEAKTFTFTSNPSLSDFTVTYTKGGVTSESAIEAGTYDVTITRQQDDTYHSVNKTFAGGLVIEQADMPNIVWPKQATLYLGQTIKEAILTGDVDKRGTFSWQDGSITPETESSITSVLIFTPSDKNYKTEEQSISIAVTKRSDISIESKPQTITYDGEIHLFKVNPTPQNLSGFNVTYTQNQKPVEAPIQAGTYDVKITRALEGGYNAFSQTITGGLIIEKATPDITWPKGAMLDSEKTLSEAILNEAGNKTEGTFSWEKPDSKLTESGIHKLIFTPKSGNYKTIEQDIQVNVVELKAITIDLAVQNAGSYDGKTKSFKITVTSEPKELTGFTVKYIQNGTALSGAPSNAGSYDVTVSRPQDEAYKAFNATIKSGLTIGKANYPAEQIVWPQNLSLYEGKKLSTLTLPVSEKGTFSWENPDQTFSTGEQTATLIFTPDNQNYNPATKTVTISVTVPPVSYKVTIKQNSGGIITIKNDDVFISNGASVIENTLLTLQATPNKDYLFSYFLINGEKTTSSEIKITKDVTLEAVFVLDPATGNEDISKDDIQYYSQNRVLYVTTTLPIKLQVVAICGTTVYNKSVSGTISLDQLSKGVYLLVFNYPDGKKVIKRIIL